MTNLAPSNFKLLEKDYSSIIVGQNDKDQTGEKSNYLVGRCTFKFSDNSYLSITEHINNRKINYYYYDWFDENKKVIMKFHSEPHKDKKYQTKTEPFHIHTKDMLSEDRRLANEKYQDLYSVLNFIQFYIFAKK